MSFSFPDPFESLDSRDPLTYTRQEILAKISKKKAFDVVVIGGGIHGSCFAHLAALNGLSCLLLEKNDYAHATSSRSSKMVHGGLRYLQQGDFKQVFEGIKSREHLFRAAPHLAFPAQFLIPVFNSWFTQIKLKIGLTLYDLFLTDKSRRHSWIKASDLSFESFSARTPGLLGCFRYCDGMVNDTRLVLEQITAARQEGALALNHAEVKTIQGSTGGRSIVTFVDHVLGSSHQTECGIIVNCAGPWVAEAGRVAKADFAKRLRFNQGIHLLFNRRWDDPPIFLPIDASKARYYWVWPHPAGTLVGTTESDLPTAEQDPQPTKVEVQEVLDRLAKDLPRAGLNRDTLHYAFAGTRTLVLSREASDGNNWISRRHQWIRTGNMLSLAGGKLTTAPLTAFEGLKLIFDLVGEQRDAVELGDRALPGACGPGDSIEEFYRWGVGRQVPMTVLEQAVARHGRSVRHFTGGDGTVLAGLILASEVQYFITHEQALSVEDIMRRRTGLEYFPGHGLEVLPEIVKMLEASSPGFDHQADARAYTQRLQSLSEILSCHENKGPGNNG